LTAAARRGTQPAMAIYKILTADQWADLDRLGETAGAPVDVADGFVHFSTAAQAPETARRHFAGQAGLVLAAVDDAALGPSLRWEPSRGGDLFPHLYGPLRRADVIWSAPLPLGPDGHLFPAAMV
jgi:uncharacterized protein (DUF952 family)